MEVDCHGLDEYITAEEIASINKLVTEPNSKRSEPRVQALNKLNDMIETGRDEDHHQKISFGSIETLTEIILPKECQKNNDNVWLASVIISSIAQNQAFADGNKRTSFLAGSLFLMRTQLEESKNIELPYLDENLIGILQDIAIGEEDAETLYDWLRQIY